jgi:hypothetical protein
MNEQDIFSFITTEETAMQNPVEVIDGYEWGIANHVRLSTLYKNSQFSQGNSEGERDNKPYKNIVRPILNLQYRAEGFDVKDIELFINDSKKYFKSFLVKKFHEKWARENKIDTFIDELVESYVDYGGVLVKDVNDVKPEVVPLQSIAFCDQTDFLSGPFGIKHYYAPDQLKDMEEFGWGKESNGATGTIEDVITLSKESKKTTDQNKQESKTPGKYVEVYEIHGMFRDSWLGKSESEKSPKSPLYSRQLHIVTLYQDKNGQKNGITLFRGKEKELPFKFLKRDPIYGRALGFGGVEELFESQVWVNYDLIRMKAMLDLASKVIYKSNDSALANRNNVTDLENGEILDIEDGKDISQVQTTPINIGLFERSVAEWEAHAQQMGAANDSIMGEAPTAGTPFKLQELVTQEAHSLHEYRKGKIAVFVDEIYKDWIIPFIVSELVKGQEFLADLDFQEMQTVADSLVVCEANKIIKELILSGQTIKPEEIESFKQRIRDEFMKGGRKKFIEIFKDEMKDAPVSVRVNIVGKQKNLAAQVDKLTNIFRQIIQAPQVLDDPRMADLFNQILESSGLSPIDFGSNVYAKPAQVAQPPQAQIQPQLGSPAMVGAGGVAQTQ